MVSFDATMVPPPLELQQSWMAPPSHPPPPADGPSDQADSALAVSTDGGNKDSGVGSDAGGGGGREEIPQKASFIFVQHLRGFLRQYLHLEICVLSTPRQMPQTIYSPLPSADFDIAEVLVSFSAFIFP